MTISEEQCRGVRHVAIIMDGNGRWAKARGRPRVFGHQQGVEAVRAVVRAGGDLGVNCLTLYGFSTENWRRPHEEVDALFGLLRRFVDADLESLAADGVRVRILGRREGLSDDIIEIIERAERRTADNSAFSLNIAFNYGGRDEIVRAARRIAAEVASGELSADAIDEDVFAEHLDSHGLPDPDLVIRTSGEQRLSNFLPWQTAYAELVFVDVLWPDFDRAHLENAIGEFRRRRRRFGGVDGS
ncbi:MAG TPA: isoprenyl transferase [Alphaproteobacteria bacterium]|nr:isoprenyl transferase [Alphaproteobacteria bacterium]